jgi:hypothetical protein
MLPYTCTQGYQRSQARDCKGQGAAGDSKTKRHKQADLASHQFNGVIGSHVSVVLRAMHKLQVCRSCATICWESSTGMYRLGHVYLQLFMLKPAIYLQK